MKIYGNPQTLADAPQQVLFSKSHDGRIAHITLNRPEKHNALSVPMRSRVQEILRQCEDDVDVHAIVFSGAGKSFCSGNEINEDWGQRAPGQKRMPLSTANRYASDMNYGRHGFSQAITRCSKITILQLHGYCAAAAYFMIATRCDLVVVSDTAKIGALEARFLGPAGAVSATHINRIIGTKAARRLGYTGEAMSGDEAYRLGLAHACVPEDRLDEEVNAMADHFAATPTALLQYCKTRLLAAESLFETNVREISGLLFSHYLQTEHDEAHFWTKVKDGGVGAALDADKARLAEVTARASRGDRMEKGQ